MGWVGSGNTKWTQGQLWDGPKNNVLDGGDPSQEGVLLGVTRTCINLLAVDILNLIRKRAAVMVDVLNIQYSPRRSTCLCAVDEKRKGSPYSIAERTVPKLIPVLWQSACR